MKVIQIFVCALLVCITPVVMAQDPTVAAPSIYKKVFENDRVRVLEVNLAAGSKIDTHSHPAHVGYVISGGKLAITDSAGKLTNAEVKPGEVLWFDPVTHSAVNTGTTELKLVIVELKK